MRGVDSNKYFLNADFIRGMGVTEISKTVSVLKDFDV